MKRICILTATSAAALITADIAHAGGFALRERSANAQGASFAGATAAANDVTYSLFNPAALGQVRTIELGGALAGIFPDITGTAQINGQEARPGVVAPLPASAFGYRVNEEFVIGLGIHSPFGLTTVYDENFVGAGDGIRSELISIAVTPMLAWNITEDFTIGAGVSAIYNDPQLTRAVGVDGNGNVLEAKLNATDLAFSYTAGALWDVTDETRLGLAFHSGYDIVTSGTLSAFDGALNPIDLPGDASISLPLSVSVGLRQKLTDDIRFLAEFEWANWSEFSEIQVNVPALARNNDLSEIADYKDSIFIAAGLEYDWSDAFTVRAGVAYDQTPTQRATRSLRIPDANRVWASVGFTYHLSESMKLDFGYSAIFFEDSDLTIMNGPAAGTFIDYSGQTHIIALGGSVTF